MPLFEEDQRFRQWWLWAILGGSCLLTLWAGSLVHSWIPAFVNLVLLSLFSALRLETRVDATEIRLRFLPLARRTIPLTEIQSCEARTYRPLREYGGWGIRGGSSGMAYNVSGDRGVQLVLTSGKRVLIGSQRADELAAIINGARRSVPSLR
jgi:hypothetical protein